MTGLVLFLPETALLVGALLVFLLSVSRAPLSRIRATAMACALAGFAGALATLGKAGHPFGPTYAVDLFSQLLKAGLAFGLVLVIVMIRGLESARADTRVDTPLFLLLSTTGMMMLVSATELLTLYVALELSAYGLYVAAAVHRDPVTGSEAGAKYVLFGAVSSAITLYGMTLVAGAAGSTYLGTIAPLVMTGSPVLAVGIVLMLAGFFYKLGAAPFHFWAPDVYMGAPHEVVTFIATTSKLAAIGAIARVVSLGGGSHASLATVFGVLAIVSMTLGNLAAIAQNDLKRLLAYSAIAHAGYLLLGYGAFSAIGLAATLFYGFAYLVFSLLAFVVVCALGADGANPTTATASGLYARSPVLAILLLVAMFGLAGIPPTAGFAGKWFLFAAAMEQKQFALVLIAAINSTIGLYYYLRVIRAAYLGQPAATGPVRASRALVGVGILAAALTVVIGVYPKPLWQVAQRASELLVRG